MIIRNSAKYKRYYCSDEILLNTRDITDKKKFKNKEILLFLLNTWDITDKRKFC